jgi:dTDP-glucose 4,6-dehydratase
MKVFITGILGVIGSQLAIELRARGHEVSGCDLTHHHAAGYFRCDIAEYRQLQDVLTKVRPDYVYNTAAEFGRWNGEAYYEQLVRTNIIGTKNVINLANELGFRMVHFSSSEVYGDFDEEMKESVTDRVVIKPMNDYAGTKMFNEWQLVNSSTMYGTQYVLVRLFNVYGNEPYSVYRSVICRFCHDALAGRPLVVFGGHKRTFIHISDVVKTLANIMDNFRPSRIYNIGNSDELLSIEEAARTIVRLAGATDELIEITEPEILTTRIKICDASLAEAELGHRVTVGFEEGIARTIRFTKNQMGRG